MRSLLIALTSCCAVTAVASSVMAQEGAAFYKGKTVTYVVATSPGGGYDFYGRLVARYMQAALPDSTFVIKNVPGAGHIVGANFIYAAKPDGLTIGTFNTGLIYAQIAKGAGVKFDLSRMSWIGKASTEQRVMVVSALSPFKTFADVQAATTEKPVKVSIGGVGSAAYAETMIIAKAFNQNFRVIPGYVGGDSEMAMRRGEIDANFGGLATYEPFVENGYGKFVLQSGGKAEQGVPQARDLAKTPEAKSLIALIDSQAEIGRFTAGPPNIPANQLETLRAAYKAAMENPELQEQAAKAEKPVEPLYGEDVAKRIRAALDQTPEMAAFIAEVTKPAEKEKKAKK
jgi:tripartite-type tricarboxylate transporter receptor subunit TctC